MGWTGSVKAYELSQKLDGYDYVIVSATVVMYSGPETYIFGATKKSLEENAAADAAELEGSYRGGLDHEQALKNAGYEVQP